MKDWNSLTIGEYQRIFDIRRRYTQAGQRVLTDVDANAEIVAVVTGQDLQDVDRMKVADYTRVLNRANEMLAEIPERTPAKRIRVPGFGWVALQYEVTEIDAGQYNELMQFTKGDGAVIDNLHRILATLAVPVKRTWWGGWKKYKRDASKHGELAQAFQAVPFLHAYNAAVFFCLIFRVFWTSSLTYLQKQKMGILTPEMERTVKQILQDFYKITDGYMPPVKWPRLKILPWNRFGVYRYCSTLMDYSTYGQNPTGKNYKAKRP